MKIVNPRANVLTAERFREKLGVLIANALEAANVEKRLAGERKHLTPEEIRQEAIERVRAIGLDPDTKEGKAAAGAVILTHNIAAGIRQYEKRSGHPVPREAMMTLEKTLAQFALPARGKVQDIKKIQLPWKKE